MKKIKLTQNKFALVDNEDFDWLKDYSWKYVFTGGKEYAIRNDKKTIYMHRDIMKTPSGVLTDHINGDGLDNRKINLRFADAHTNSANRKIPNTNTSGYKGVHKHQTKWLAQISNKGKYIYIGVFETPQLAAKAYDMYARTLYGNFAVLNFKSEDKVPDGGINK